MNQVINATFDNGLLKPDEPLNLPPGTRVQLIIQTLGEQPGPDAWEEFEKLCEEISVDSGGARLTRDQLHERR